MDVEHETDDVTSAVLRELNSTFVTPRRWCTSTAWTRLSLYPPEMGTLIEIISASADLLAAAMPRLKGRKELEEYWIAARDPVDFPASKFREALPWFPLGTERFSDRDGAGTRATGRAENLWGDRACPFRWRLLQRKGHSALG
ncbi:MAG: hypothetical protein DLM55_00385 [Acidimicrobiales bacterium]|nr:MAG: hypothetical protein DLM55_00385 [Acidimicrobiales bacterium]